MKNKSETLKKCKNPNINSSLVESFAKPYCRASAAISPSKLLNGDCVSEYFWENGSFFEGFAEPLLFKAKIKKT